MLTRLLMLGLMALAPACCAKDDIDTSGGEAHDGGSGMTADSPEFIALNRVLQAHADELMAMDGVVGVAIGLQEDGSPCLKILVAELTPKRRSLLPTSLDGHPVVLEESGVIRPFGEE
jgi:hypothetical protein